MKIDFKDICGNSIALQLPKDATVLFACRCLSEKLDLSENQIFLVSPSIERNFYSNNQLIQDIIKENPGFITFTKCFKKDFLQKNENTSKRNTNFFEHSNSIKILINYKNINYTNNSIYTKYSEYLNEIPDDFQQKVDEIAVLGYEIEDIKEALRKSEYNVLFAINYLVQPNTNERYSNNSIIKSNSNSNRPIITNNSNNPMNYVQFNSKNKFNINSSLGNNNSNIKEFSFNKNRSDIDLNTNGNNNNVQEKMIFNNNNTNNSNEIKNFSFKYNIINLNNSNKNEAISIDNKISFNNRIQYADNNFKFRNKSSTNIFNTDNSNNLWNKKPSVWYSNNNINNEQEKNRTSNIKNNIHPQKPNSWNFNINNNNSNHDFNQKPYNWNPSKK